MTNVITSAICTSEFAALNAAVEAWQNDTSEELMVFVGGFRVKGISRQLEQSIERFLNATANQGKKVAPDAKETLIVIDDYARAYAEYKEASDVLNDGSVSNHAELGRQFGNLLEHFKTRPFYPRPQSMQSLVSQGVNHIQIAAIYGPDWLKPNGSPDSAKILEEAAAPGTHYNKETWQHPGELNRQRMIDTEWRNRGVNRSAIYDHSESEATAESSQPSPEPTKWNPPSLVEMVRLRAPARQIANVHGISEDEAAQMLLDVDQPKSNLLLEV